MSSGIVDHPAQGVASYGSSKIALEYLMKCLAVELSRAHPQLRTCAIHPGIVQQTEMFKAYHDQGKVHFSQDHLAWLEDTLEERKQGRQEVLDLVPNIEQVAEKLGRLVIKGLSEDYHGRVVFWKDFP